MQQRQGEACRFAGAGLGARHQVVAVENGGNRFRLNGRGRVVAFFANGAQQGLGEAEGVKCHESFLCVEQ